MTTIYLEIQNLLNRLARNETPSWQPLLDALLKQYPGDAATLMVREGNALMPVAVRGLPSDVRGRAFQLDAHPRLAVIAKAEGVHRFAPDDPSPDPFDGLINTEGDALHVHDCMGVALRGQGRMIGMLTLDALEAGQFDSIDYDELGAMAGLLGASLDMALCARQTRAQLKDVLNRSGAGLPAQSLTWRSNVMRQLDDEIALVAQSEMSVLIQGETGVGKERIATQVHARSPRRDGPLIKLNCAALSPSLIESELFGHVKGAFSGAFSSRRGHFALADGGTLFLDEVGELPLALQPKLLRVLQEGEYQPLGSEHTRTTSVRVVAATNRDLELEVAEGRFRADLYHRLCVYPLVVPPLRARGEDVLLLAGTFLEENRSRFGLRNLRLSTGAEAALADYCWPGNVRELEHVLSRATLKARPRPGDVLTLTADHLDLALGGATAAVPAPAREETAQPLREAVDDFQRRHIDAVYTQCDGNWAETARRLGLDRGNLHRLASRLGLK
ncbi:nitric oxide reductase transcriptional regulator NorR [Larsenimonas suaedae]|uniref:Nitric oxide reductase transcriptional regulator NorR n=1 Tax=Larsenimonas suaedae TaxID=1851019 RepID=A0ABU1GWA0_9GAMM|nr:nitric oxide reductase transcriptional regulator NorR [Larsenimonas suaedae]MCM2973390.1 nitric oxide reductase transcriptional regulator NorR [Larsenimonas suaedae]MDR5896283.1 nitric oxide reductase transcriptional regulator NorR [Larsenimonas suaedae]